MHSKLQFGNIYGSYLYSELEAWLICSNKEKLCNSMC